MGKLKALIVGCGGIACFWDSPSSVDVLTHAHALTRRGIDLHFYDRDFSLAQKASKLWNGQSFEKFPKDEHFDLVIISASTKAHFELLNSVIGLKCETIVCEKPFCNTLTEAKAVIGQLNEKRLFINYSRNYHPLFKKIRSEIQANKYGERISFQGTYSKGIRHNGSHMLSLLILFFGDFFEHKILQRRKEKLSGQENMDLWIGNEKISGVINGVDEKFYSIWELKLYFSEKIIHIRDFGRSVEYYDLISDPNYPDYTIINNLPTVIENVDLGLCFDGLYDEAIRQIGEKKLSSIQNSIKVHELLEKFFGE